MMLQRVKDIFFNTPLGNYYWLLRTWPMRKSFPKLHILTIEETIDKIIKNKLSISRFGDGEFILLMEKRDIVFQKLSHKISQRLFEVINSNASNHLVCLTSALTDRKNYTHYSKTYWVNFLNRYGLDLMNKMMNHKNIYGNALISRFYLHRKNKENTILIVEKLKKIWDKQDVLFVEGELSRLGIGNDLFDNAKSIERIICPAENAFEKYDEILNKSLEFGKNKLVILALGPTATVLAYDLSQNGIWALDLGHIDIEYSWFRMNATSHIAVSGKKTAEVSTQTDFDLSPELKKEYESSIVYKISE
jgi:glycosyltransferase family protein